MSSFVLSREGDSISNIFKNIAGKIIEKFEVLFLVFWVGLFVLSLPFSPMEHKSR